MVPALELAQLVKRFGSTTAVDRIDLAVPSGELVALLGPSGCGKTTTLRIVAGFERPDSGRVRIQGVDVTATPPYRRDTGMVFQHYALFPHMTVRENVGFGLRMRGVDRSEAETRVREALALVSLSGLEGRYPRQLSGGQQQRVALARALVIRPQLLLLDEPLSSLDAKLRQEMRLEVRAIQRRVGITALFVTHDQEEALSLADRVAVINQGRVEQVGTPVEVYTQFFVHTLHVAVNGTVPGLMIGHVMVCLPWVVRVLIAGLQGADPAVEEAAMNLGARPLAVLWHITLPLLRPALVAAGIFAFIASFGNVELSLMLSVPGTSTLPVVILTYLDNYNDPSVAALSTVLIAGTAAVIVVADRRFGLGKLI